jgi:glycosyltransferase involved in cell wall biosynthesis
LPSLSIVIPAYNEERRLPAALERIEAFCAARNFEFSEILVVDDGSRDATAQLAREASARNPAIGLLRNPGNRGKGYAVRHGMREARGEWVLFTDADLSAPIEEFDKLWAAVEQSGADGAIGSRALDRSLIGVHQPWLRELSGRVFNLHMRLVAGLSYRDTQCGFKLFSARAAQALAARQRLERFGFDVEILYIARKLGLEVLEIPVRWDDVAGTKVSLWAGVKAFADPWKVRWNDLKGLYR